MHTYRIDPVKQCPLGTDQIFPFNISILYINIIASIPPKDAIKQENIYNSDNDV